MREERRRDEDYYYDDLEEKRGGASIWDRDWTTVTPHIEAMQERYKPLSTTTCW